MTDTYITLNELKAALNIGTADTVDDVALTSVMSSAAGAVTAYCDRYFGQVGTLGTPVARMYQPVGGVVPIDDLSTITDVEIDGTVNADAFTTVGTAAVIPLPANAATEDPARPFTSLRAKSTTTLPSESGWVRVTGVWGWPAVPQPIKDATLLQAVQLFTAKTVPLGIVGGMDVAPMRLGTGLHPSARALCEPYVRTNF